MQKGAKGSFFILGSLMIPVLTVCRTRRFMVRTFFPFLLGAAILFVHEKTPPLQKLSFLE